MRLDSYRTVWRKYGRNGAVFACALLSGYALSVNSCVVNLTGLEQYSPLVKMAYVVRGALGEVTPASAIAVAAVISLENRVLFRRESRYSTSAFLTACVLAFFRLLGLSFGADRSLSYITGNPYQLLVAVCVFIGYTLILYSLVKLLFLRLDTCGQKKADPVRNQRLNKKAVFFGAVVTMLVCWSVFWILFFPGSITHDAQNQMEQYLGARQFSNHHPFLSTLVMGAIIEAGKQICDYTFGVALFVVFQSLVCAASFSYLCTYLYRKTQRCRIFLMSLAFFSVLPMWSASAQALMKDTLYCGFFVLFAVEYVRLYLEDTTRWTWLRLTCSGALVCFYRNEGIYMVIAALLVLVMMSGRNRKKAIAALMCIVLVFYGGGSAAKNALGIKEGSAREALSIPLQQTARYVVKYGHTLTKAEKAVIDQVIPYDAILESYNPELSDPIKNKWRNPTEEELDAFWTVWLQNGLRHPKVYAEATLNHVFGYLDPFYFYSGMSQYQLYNKGPLSGATEEIFISDYIFGEGAQSFGTQYAYAWNKLPVLSFLVSPGAYAWVEVILLAIVLRKKRWKDAAVYLLPVMTVLVCFASPVNGLQRYVLPLMASMPLWTWFSVRDFCPGGEVYEHPTDACAK